MTLAIALASPHCVWMAADRRYGHPLGHLSGRKMCLLDTADSKGIISYAGVGARARNQPLEVSEWIKRTLRGIDAPLDQLLEILAAEAVKQSMDKLTPSHHAFMYVGFHNKKAIIDFITSANRLALTPARPGDVKVVDLGGQRFNRYRLNVFGLGAATIGSGESHIDRKKLVTGLNRYIQKSATSAGHVQAVSNRLASAILAASRKDKGVSPESICISIRADGTTRQRDFDKNGRCLPDVGVGVPSLQGGIPVDDVINAIAPVIMPHHARVLEAMKKGEELPSLDEDALAEAIKAVRDDPDGSF